MGGRLASIEKNVGGCLRCTWALMLSRSKHGGWALTWEWALTWDNTVHILCIERITTFVSGLTWSSMVADHNNRHEPLAF